MHSPDGTGLRTLWFKAPLGRDVSWGCCKQLLRSSAWWASNSCPCSMPLSPCPCYCHMLQNSTQSKRCLWKSFAEESSSLTCLRDSVSALRMGCNREKNDLKKTTKYLIWCFSSGIWRGCFGKSCFCWCCVLWESGFEAVVIRGVGRICLSWLCRVGDSQEASFEASAQLEGCGVGLRTKEYQPVHAGKQPAHQWGDWFFFLYIFFSPHRKVVFVLFLCWKGEEGWKEKTLCYLNTFCLFVFPLKCFLCILRKSIDNLSQIIFFTCFQFAKTVFHKRIFLCMLCLGLCMWEIHLCMNIRVREVLSHLCKVGRNLQGKGSLASVALGLYMHAVLIRVAWLSP